MKKIGMTWDGKIKELTIKITEWDRMFMLSAIADIMKEAEKVDHEAIRARMIDLKGKLLQAIVTESKDTMSFGFDLP